MPGIVFDRAAHCYDATRGYNLGTADRIRDAILRHTGAGMEARFLELGIGTGRIAIPFVQAGYRCTGVDLSLPMLRILARKMARGTGHCHICQADVTDLPFATGHFDIVLAVQLIHLIDGWQHALREVRRVLREQGSWLLLGYDEMPREAGAEEISPPLVAQYTWGDILAELGWRHSGKQPGVRPIDTHLDTYLRSLGASTHLVHLTNYERPPLSARMVVERCRDRVYSSDWALPDDVHAQAIERLEHWLRHDCAAPDEPFILTGRFMALVAHWSA